MDVDFIINDWNTGNFFILVILDYSFVIKCVTSANNSWDLGVLNLQ